MSSFPKVLKVMINLRYLLVVAFQVLSSVPDLRGSVAFDCQTVVRDRRRAGGQEDRRRAGGHQEGRRPSGS